MNHTKTILPFIGAKNFELSKQFYLDFGFKESVISHDMSRFDTNTCGFYLQAYYVKDWVDNTMLFLEVENLDNYWKELEALDLPSKYAKVRLVPIKTFDWGKEGFIYDPSGILWHIGEFSS